MDTVFGGELSDRFFLLEHLENHLSFDKSSPYSTE